MMNKKVARTELFIRQDVKYRSQLPFSTYSKQSKLGTFSYTQEIPVLFLFIKFWVLFFT